MSLGLLVKLFSLIIHLSTKKLDIHPIIYSIPFYITLKDHDVSKRAGNHDLKEKKKSTQSQ